jgi:hypothetical protein
VSENRVLRRIFRPKRDKMTGSWRKLHSEELHNLFSAPDIVRVTKSRRMRWAGHVVCMGEMRNTYKILVEKSEGTRPPRIPRHRWEDNTNMKMDLKEIIFGSMYWINLAQDRDWWQTLVDMVMNLQVP